jgi:hypothetical protein
MYTPKTKPAAQGPGPVALALSLPILQPQPEPAEALPVLLAQPLAVAAGKSFWCLFLGLCPLLLTRVYTKNKIAAARAERQPEPEPTEAVAVLLAQSLAEPGRVSFV